MAVEPIDRVNHPGPLQNFAKWAFQSGGADKRLARSGMLLTISFSVIALLIVLFALR